MDNVFKRYFPILMLIAFTFNIFSGYTAMSQTKLTSVDTIEIKSIPKDTLALSESIHLKKYNSKYKFSDFKTEVYKGKLANPNFKNNPFSKDSEYVQLIKDGCRKNKINFAGHYTVIDKSCGCMCEWIFIVDRINGKVFVDSYIKDNENEDGKFGYLYKANSRLLIVNSGLFKDNTLEFYSNDEGIKPELYVWNGEVFTFLE